MVDELPVDLGLDCVAAQCSSVWMVHDASAGVSAVAVRNCRAPRSPTATSYAAALGALAQVLFFMLVSYMPLANDCALQLLKRQPRGYLSR